MWLFCTAKNQEDLCQWVWEQDRALLGQVLPGHTELEPGATRGCPVAAGPLPWHMAADCRERAVGKAEQGCGRGERCQWLCSLDRTARARSSCWAVPAPVCLSVPEGPVFIYAHHFLPPGAQLLPNISALLPNFCHLFSRSWHREWEFFPSRLLLEVTPEQDSGHQPAWPRPSPSPVPLTLTLSLFATTTKESGTRLFILPCSGFNSAKPLSRWLWVGPGLSPSLSAFLNKGLASTRTPSEQVFCHCELSYQWDCPENDQREGGERGERKWNCFVQNKIKTKQ